MISHSIGAYLLGIIMFVGMALVLTSNFSLRNTEESVEQTRREVTFFSVGTMILEALVAIAMLLPHSVLTSIVNSANAVYAWFVHVANAPLWQGVLAVIGFVILVIIAPSVIRGVWRFWFSLKSWLSTPQNTTSPVA